LRTTAGDAASTLDWFNFGAGRVVEVHITQHLNRQILPPLVANFVPGDLKLLNRETWRPTGEGQARGESYASASGGVGSSRTTTGSRRRALRPNCAQLEK